MVNRKLLGLVIVIAIGVTGLSIGIYYIMTLDSKGPETHEEPPSLFQAKWNQTWGGAYSENVYALYLDSMDDIFLIGTTDSPTKRCFLKYNSSGILQSYNLSSGKIDTVAREDLNSYITEEETVYTPFGPKYSTDLYKYNNSGGIIWSITDLKLGRAISDAFGNVYLSVQSNYEVNMVKFNNSGDLQWNITWNSVDIIVSSQKITDSMGNFYLAGEIYLDPGFNIYLTKFNSTGDLQWEKTWGGSNVDYLYQIGIDSLNNIYLSGITFGVNSLYLVKYNSAGIWQWDYTWNAAGDSDELTAIHFDSSDNIYLTGWIGSPSYCNVTLIKINDQGTYQWKRSWGGSAPEEPGLLVSDSVDNVYVAGRTRSFGAGLYDIFLIKYNSTGDFQGEYIWGGNGMETLNMIALDSFDNLYLTGITNSFGAGDYDIFLIKLT
ncbi:MAG: hypothetical protein KAW66_06930 [Candidatus Lokiarchaeota archaeon]|nr:hypothetical protein [Candidatus Lokiarchaeota archaeon]